MEFNLDKLVKLNEHFHIYVFHQVMWLSPHHEPLTRNDHVITADKRFSVDHPYQSEWNLEISGVKMDDRGNYTCMISSTPVQKKIVHLRIVCKCSLLCYRRSCSSAHCGILLAPSWINWGLLIGLSSVCRFHLRFFPLIGLFQNS